jgi:hypothetical protein
MRVGKGDGDLAFLEDDVVTGRRQADVTRRFRLRLASSSKMSFMSADFDTQSLGNSFVHRIGQRLAVET